MKRSPVVAVMLSLAMGCSDSARAPFHDAAVPQTKPTAPAAEQPNSQPNSQPSSELISRKIIYNASIDLVVDDLSKAAPKLDELVKRDQGLVAQSAINSNPGAPRAASWRIRVPVNGFADFVHQVAKLGEAVTNKTDSDDVTDKYFDFQVRIENKKVQVERLQKIIKEQTGKISELLEAERELSRVTTELEQLKGTVKLWDNQVALATVNITMHERRQYVAKAAPSFGKNISRTFASSWDALITFVQSLVLIVVAATPWLPVIAILVAAFWFLLRRANQGAAVSRARALSAEASSRDSGRGSPTP
jgi:hypothetical protein